MEGSSWTHAHWRAGETDLGEAGANDVLTRQECRAARGARLLAVILQEPKPFLPDAVDIGRFVAHEPVAVGADICDADVIAVDDEDVRLSCRLPRGFAFRLGIGLPPLSLSICREGEQSERGSETTRPHGFLLLDFSGRNTRHLCHYSACGLGKNCGAIGSEGKAACEGGF